MRQLADKAKWDWRIRTLAAEITQGLTNKDYRSEALAIYQWVCNNIRYTRDPHRVEMVEDPLVLLQTRATDCDGMATLIAALGMSIGIPMRFVTVGFRAHGAHSHVYAQALIAPGTWLTLDPVAADKTREMLGRVQTMRIY